MLESIKFNLKIISLLNINLIKIKLMKSAKNINKLGLANMEIHADFHMTNKIKNFNNNLSKLRFANNFNKLENVDMVINVVLLTK